MRRVSDEGMQKEEVGVVTNEGKILSKDLGLELLHSPDPVFAVARTSLPVSARGHAAAWIGEGSLNPAALSAAWRAGGKGASSNRWKSGGSPCPPKDWTVMSWSFRYS